MTRARHDLMQMIDVHQFFSWEQVSSFAGATAATVVFARLLGNFGLVERVPAAILHYTVALALLVGAEFFTPPPPTARGIVLCILNAAGVALASIGANALSKTQHDGSL